MGEQNAGTDAGTTVATRPVAVVNRLTGQTITDVRTASLDELVLWLVSHEDIRQEFRVGESIVNEEIVARLDRDRSWTQRIAITGDVQYEVSTPSPDAGSVEIAALGLERELRALIARGTISERAAGAALRRRVLLTVDVPFDRDLEPIVDQLRAAISVTLGDVECKVVEVDGIRQVMKAGITALLKGPGVKAAIDRVSSTLPIRSRKAKIRAVTRER